MMLVVGDAREKFEVGMRVRPSDLGIQERVVRAGRGGVVAGFSHSPHCVRIVKDGSNSPATYSMDFWEPAEA